LRWSVAPILIVETKNVVIGAYRNVFLFASTTHVLKEPDVNPKTTEKLAFVVFLYKEMALPTAVGVRLQN
jgi:hypothetical protein